MLLIAQHLDGGFATLRTNRASLPTDYDGRLRRDGWGDQYGDTSLRIRQQNGPAHAVMVTVGAAEPLHHRFCF